MKAKLVFLGTGTSQGVPFIACKCPRCTSADPYDKRFRCSAYILREDGISILIDFGADFRLQAIRAKIRDVSFVLNTHSHADHICGLDDLCPFATKHPITIYTNEIAKREITESFNYLFSGHHTGYSVPPITLEIKTEPFDVGSVHIIPFTVLHGKLPISAYRLGNLTYITDCSEIPEEAYSIINGTEILIINGLRMIPHATHFSYSQTLNEIEKIQPKEAYIIHHAHNLTHEQVRNFIREQQAIRPLLQNIKIEPAYDNLVLENIMFDQ